MFATKVNKGFQVCCSFFTVDTEVKFKDLVATFKSYAAPRYWNAHQVDLRFLNKLDTLKRNIKTYLFNNFSVLKSKAFIYH